MIHINKKQQYIQFYNLLKSIADAPNDYLVIYSYGVAVGWCCKASFLTPELGNSELDRIMTLAKQLEKARKLEIAVQIASSQQDKKVSVALSKRYGELEDIL